MDNNSKEIIVANSLNNTEIPKNFTKDYFTHVLCQNGSGQFVILSKEYKITSNDIVIFLPGIPVIDLMLSPDFKAQYLLVSSQIMNKNNPDIGWSINGYLFSQENPVVTLTEEDRNKCMQNFDLLKAKYNDQNHRFRKEILNLQLQIFVMDMWQIFSDKMQQRIFSNEKGSFFERFLQLVEMNCMENREVNFYSDKMCISPKYLNEICKKNSGETASYWIQTLTIQRLIMLLKNPDLNFTEIAHAFNFSSQSFFSRYVRKVLGVSPSEYRGRLKD